MPWARESVRCVGAGAACSQLTCAKRRQAPYLQRSSLMPSQGLVAASFSTHPVLSELELPSPKGRASLLSLGEKVRMRVSADFDFLLSAFETTCKELNFRRAVQFRSNLDHAGTRIVYMKSSTKDKIRGNVDQAKGSVQEKAGRASRDPEMQDRGTAN